MKKLILLIIVVSLMGACATTPKDRFPLIYEDPLKAKKINLIIDTMVYTDIKGADIGYNEMKNNDLLAAVEQQIVPKFEEKGYEVTIIRSGIGLLHQPLDNEERAHVISVDGESTEEPWPGPQEHIENPLFMDDVAKDYLRGLLAYSSMVGIPNTNSKKKRLAKEHYYGLEKPAFLEDESLGTIVLVRAVVQEVSKGKATGSALLTGLLSAALSGGTYIYMSMPMTTLHFDMVFLDTQTEEIVWQGSNSLAGNIDTLARNSDMVLANLPARDGAAVMDTDSDEINVEEGN